METSVAAHTRHKFLLKLTAKEMHLENTLLNGQCFNWWKLYRKSAEQPKDGETKLDLVYQGVFRKHFVEMQRLDTDTIEVRYQRGEQETNYDFEEVFTQEYLNIKPDLNIEKLYSQWSKADPEFFGQVATPLVGMRCLRQDPSECTMSFICTQNSNIKSGTQLVRTFRNNFGEPICKVKIPAAPVKSKEVETQVVEETVYSFPSIKSIVDNVSLQRLKDLGFGYRALYIVVSAKHILNMGGDEWLLGLRSKPCHHAQFELRQMMGVGCNVAGRIALFSLDKAHIIPLDMQVFQIAEKLGFVKGKGRKRQQDDKVNVQITTAFIRKYGNKAGWAQQVLFVSELKSFKDTIDKSRTKDQASESVEEMSAVTNKKRTLDQITPDSATDLDPEVKEPPTKRRKE